MRSRTTRISLIPHAISALTLFIAILLCNTSSALAQTESVLYNFCSRTKCSDGASSYAGLIRDKRGDLYGTTKYGGTNNNGIVFVWNVDGTERVLHKFVNDGTDGYNPNSGLVMDASHNLYGTTYRGGARDYGTVFKISCNGTESVLYSFGSNGTDGLTPAAGLVIGKNGNLYGTTLFGGANFYYGTVFEITPAGTETTLYSFAGYAQTDGANPYGGLIMDKNGNLYGATQYGGANGSGAVFEVSAAGAERVLHSFVSDGTDGYYPYAGLLIDAKGDLYGTTYQGGANNAGTVFEIDTSGTEKILYSFGASTTDGYNPWAGLVRDKLGNLYGTTLYGGANGSNFGTVFQLSPSGTETILHSFSENGTDGYQPYGRLIMDESGNLYGTTIYGGTGASATGGAGTIFKITQ